MNTTSTERSALEPQVGDALSELLVTDTIMWQVIKKTQDTITIAMMTETGYHWKQNPEAHLPVVFSEVALMNTNVTKTLRRRKDGMFWFHSHCPAVPATPRRDDRGLDVFANRTDYSF